MNKPRVIDLFCGAGGFSHGFQSAGFKIVLGVDNWKGCEETFRHNHEGADFRLKDINELDPHDLPECDVIIGSPPCTEFSQANREKDALVGFTLVDAFLGIVEAIEPDYWIMENVSNRELLDHVSDYPKMVVRCSDFGLRTMRKRLFCGQFPQPFSLGSRDWKLQFPSVNTKDPYTQLKETDWRKRDVVYPTVTCEMRDGSAARSAGNKLAFARRGIKQFTPEFAAWVQTFPESFEFFGSKTARYKMIGNAVPPEMAYILANAILDDMRESGNESGKCD